MASLKKAADSALPSGTAVIRTRMSSVHPSAPRPCGLASSRDRLLPRGGPPGAHPPCSEDLFLVPPGKGSRRTLIGSGWVTCPSLNQSLAQGKQHSDWPGLDHVPLPSLGRKVKPAVEGERGVWAAAPGLVCPPHLPT